MITVRVPRDIRAYKSKVLAGLTFRGIISFVVGGIIIGALIFLNKKMWHMSGDNLGFVVLFALVPVALVGFFRPDGMAFEHFFGHFLRFTTSKKVLVYKSKNVFSPYSEQKLSPKQAKKRSIERAVIFAESLENGENLSLENADKQLVSVKFPKEPKKPKKEKSAKKSADEKKLDKLQSKVDEINKRKSIDENTIISDKERVILRDYNTLKVRIREKEIEKKSKPVKTQNKKAKPKSSKTVVPKTVQDSIPYIAIFEDGIFEVKKGVFSKMYKLEDINYFTAESSQQVDFFAAYAEFLNSFDASITLTVYLDNRVVSKSEQEHRILYPLTGDKWDERRVYYNNFLLEQMKHGRNNMVQEKYLAVTINAFEFAEAAARFRKIDIIVDNGVKKFSSSAKSLSTVERLEILHDKYRRGCEGLFKINLDETTARGISTKDFIAPMFISKKGFRQVQISDKETNFYRVMHLNNLPAQLADTFLKEFVDQDFPVTTAINIVPIETKKALKMVTQQKTDMEAEIMNSQKKAAKSGYSPDIAVPFKLRNAYNDADELHDDVINKGQKMFLVSLLVMFSAPDLDTLEQHEEALSSKANEITAQLQTLSYRQIEGMQTCMLTGYPCADLGVNRALTSESTAGFIPFSCQELLQRGGINYGLNSISRNLIMLDRTKLVTPSGFVIGTSGGGKSFSMKLEMQNVLFRDASTPIIIIDPENEYAPFVKENWGEVIDISVTSNCHINPMEMSEDYGLDENDIPSEIPLYLKKEKALKKKTEYLLSVIECMLKGELNPQQKSFVDKCIGIVYKEYLEQNFDAVFLPTLQDLQHVFDERTGLNKVKKSKAKSEEESEDSGERYKNFDDFYFNESEEARHVREGCRLYTEGSFGLFSHKSNVNLDNRIISFGIRDLGKGLAPLALLIVLDFIWNKMCEGNQMGRRTYCYSDEIHVLFKSQSSAEFLQQLYKRGRKYGLVITGITQDLDDLIESKMGVGMIKNSNFLLFLKQSEKAAAELKTLLDLSEAQCDWLKACPAGCGMLKADRAFIPFINKFPKENPLYRVFTTDFNDKIEEKNNSKT